MTPILCKQRQVVNIADRKFYCFIDCALISIEPSLRVADYTTCQNERDNVYELLEVTGLKQVTGRCPVEMLLLGQYQINFSIDNKVVAYYKFDPDSFFIVFDDKTYICEEVCNDVNGTSLYHLDLTSYDLKSVGAISAEEYKQVETDYMTLEAYRRQLQARENANSELATLKKLATKYRATLLLPEAYHEA